MKYKEDTSEFLEVDVFCIDSPGFSDLQIQILKNIIERR